MMSKRCLSIELSLKLNVKEFLGLLRQQHGQQQGTAWIAAA
jgi:hypothetical protein